MTKQISFTKIENDLLPKFRKAIGAAESTEDVKKFFIYIFYISQQQPPIMNTSPDFHKSWQYK